MPKKTMTNWKTYLLTAICLLVAQMSNGQSEPSIDETNNKKDHSDYTNEFFISGGYNYCRFNFIDAGLRYYRWKNDGQTIMAFAGLAAGCEFSFGHEDQLYIPYIGWQGQ